MSGKEKNRKRGAVRSGGGNYCRECVTNNTEYYDKLHSITGGLRSRPPYTVYYLNHSVSYATLWHGGAA